MGNVRAMPCGPGCGGCRCLQGVSALQPVLQSAPWQSDGHICSRMAGLDGFLEHSAPADGGLRHFYGRTIKQPKNNALVTLCHRKSIILVHHVAKLCGTGF